MARNPTVPRSAVRRLAVARLISITGGAAAYTALMFTVYERTHSAAWLSATLFLTFGVSGFAAPVGGWIGDRFDRKRVMIASDLLGVACFGAMALAHDPAWLLGLAFGSALVETPFCSDSGAAIPNLVEPKELGWANGMVSLGKNVGIMVGPAAGGALLAVIGPSWVFAANGLSFAVSALLVALVRGRFSVPQDQAPREHRGMRAGFVFIVRDRVLRTVVLGWVALVGGMGVVMVADVPLVEHFHAGSLGYGLLITTWGAGSVAGSLAGRRLDEGKEPRALILGMALIGASTGAIAVSPWFAPILVMGFVSGFGDAVAMVADQGIQQRRTPDAVRSRVMAAAESISTISYAVCLAGAGAVLGAVGPQGAYAIGGITAMVGAGLVIPVLRSADTERSEPELEPAITSG